MRAYQKLVRSLHRTQLRVAAAPLAGKRNRNGASRVWRGSARNRIARAHEVARLLTATADLCSSGAWRLHLQSNPMVPPNWAAMLRCTNLLPKPSSIVGATMGGPPRSVHYNIIILSIA